MLKLTYKEIKEAKPKDKPYKIVDGLGLYLLIQPSGSKLWRMDFTFNGKRLSTAELISAEIHNKYYEL